MTAMNVPLRDTYFVATHNSRSSHKLKIMDYITYTLFDVLLSSIAKNFLRFIIQHAKLLCPCGRNLRGMRDKRMRSGTELAQEIQSTFDCSNYTSIQVFCQEET